MCSLYESNLVHKASERLCKIKCKNFSREDLSLDNGALAMFMDLKLTKCQYENLRQYNELLIGAKYYPSYKVIGEKKKQCYPENIIVDDIGASVSLQDLLNHTSRRILQILKDDLKHKQESEFELSVKWGMDGSTGQQVFNHKWETDQENNVIDERSIFMITIVPLKLITQNSNEVIWKNDKPNSIRYCRPVQFKFVKETREYVQQEYDNISAQIQNLKSTEFEFSNTEKYRVKYNFMCTMVDGKVINILTGQRSPRCCNICGATPNMMNDFENIRSIDPIVQNYRFGLSTLHCWIRFMECILHIGYNMDFKKANATKDFKDLQQTKKKNIQHEMRRKLGLSIDMVSPDTANSNDGNVARTFFKNYAEVSSILGVDLSLIKRFYIILQVLASGYEVNIEKFQEYCNFTAKLYIELYSWYKMPPTVHKVLIHGSAIVEHLDLAIGSLSEEAQEASNKIFKRARLCNSRNFSRTLSNEDVFHYMLISSDPVVSSIRIKTEKKKEEMLPDTLELVYYE